MYIEVRYQSFKDNDINEENIENFFYVSNDMTACNIHLNLISMN